MANLTGKLRTYYSACRQLGSVNWKGIPGLPKRLSPAIPYNRHNFNTFITWICRLNIHDAKFIIDIGANHGDFSAAASSCFPQSQVLLFEPLPTLHKELKTRGDYYQGWTLDPRAVGSVPARLPLHLPEGPDDIASLAGFSNAYESTTGKRGHAILECDVVPLDQALAEHGIRHPDLIKIDVEGFEFEVLQGAKESLAYANALVIELSLIRQQYSGPEPLAEMIRVLESHHFRIVDIIPSLYSNLHPWMPVEYNILARKAPTL